MPVTPMSSVGAKRAESGGKERQIRLPFHLDVQFLRKEWRKNVESVVDPSYPIVSGCHFGAPNWAKVDIFRHVLGI